jgi:drug/metabolite transporter (DMT)-like permease
MLILLALGPSLLGHSLLNWSSRHLQIFKVNLTLLLEPVIATLAGILLFFEFPGFYFYAGGALIMLSLAYLVYLERKPTSN